MSRDYSRLYREARRELTPNSRAARRATLRVRAARDADPGEHAGYRAGDDPLLR